MADVGKLFCVVVVQRVTIRFWSKAEYPAVVFVDDILKHSRVDRVTGNADID